MRNYEDDFEKAEMLLLDALDEEETAEYEDFIWTGAWEWSNDANRVWTVGDHRHTVYTVDLGVGTVTR